MKRIIFAMLFCLTCAAFGLDEQAQFSAGYVYQGSQAVVGNSGFGLNGGRADVVLPLTRQFGAVAEFSGLHAGSVAASGSGLTLLNYMAGPRFSFPIRAGREAGTLMPFAQALFGGTHATEGAFPNGTTLNSRADAFAMSLGGGLQVGVSQRVSLRLIQADYLYTRLPNLYQNYQNSYRIGAGVVLHLR